MWRITSNAALLFPHLSNLAGFSLHYNQKEIEHRSLKKWAIGSPWTSYARLWHGTCSVGRVPGFLPRLSTAPKLPPIPQVMRQSVQNCAHFARTHKVSPLSRNCPRFESQESVESSFVAKGFPGLDCLKSPISYCSGRSSCLAGLCHASPSFLLCFIQMSPLSSHHLLPPCDQSCVSS